MQKHYEGAAHRAFELIFCRAMGQLDRCHPVMLPALCVHEARPRLGRYVGMNRMVLQSGFSGKPSLHEGAL